MRTRHIIAFVVLVGSSFAGSGALAWDQDPFAMYFQRSDKITLRRGRRQGSERRHPRHRPVAALCWQPANSGERRSTVARGRALPPGIVPAASAADLAVSVRAAAVAAVRRRRWAACGGGGSGGGGAGGGGGPLVAGRYNEAEPICGRIPKIMNAEP